MMNFARRALIIKTPGTIKGVSLSTIYCLVNKKGLIMFEKAKVGDKCWSIQLGDCVIIDTRQSLVYPIQVRNTTGNKVHSYTTTGHDLCNDIAPSLFWSKPVFEMPPQPKRMVKKVLHGWVNIYPNDIVKFTHCIYATKENASKGARPDVITCIEINQEYEVEE